MPAGGLSGFVGRAGSPAPSRPGTANSRREQQAASLKIQPKRTYLLHEPAQAQTGARRQSLMHANNTAGQSNQGQRRGSGETVNGRHDPYGTDAGSSIDTTINDRSMIKEEHGQQIQQQQLAQDDDQSSREGDSSESEERSDDEEEEEEEEEEYEYDDQNNGFEINQDNMEEAEQALIAQSGYYAEGNSYPSTTSGPPEDVFNQWDIGQRAPVNTVEYDVSNEPIPPQKPKSHASRQNQPTFQGANLSAAVPPTKPGATMFQKGAAIRPTYPVTNANANLSVRVGSHPAGAAPVPSRQPPSYSQTNPQIRAPGPVSQIPQRGNPPHSNLPRVPPAKQVHVAPAAPAPVALPSQPRPHPQLKEEPAVHYQPIEEDMVHESEGPVEDYDAPDLFNLSYDQLRNEDFDHDPRGTNVGVLSGDMQQRDLPERLVHAQKNLNADGQDKFFRLLPTREWEDAGDWFLDQFSSIINRAKEARQNKRKLAREFEDEAEKRYRKVAKRQQNVEAALDGMKAKGQGLIPKSPRASREPVSRTPRSRKR